MLLENSFTCWISHICLIFAINKSQIGNRSFYLPNVMCSILDENQINCHWFLTNSTPQCFIAL